MLGTVFLSLFHLLYKHSGRLVCWVSEFISASLSLCDSLCICYLETCVKPSHTRLEWTGQNSVHPRGQGAKARPKPRPAAHANRLSSSPTGNHDTVQVLRWRNLKKQLNSPPVKATSKRCSHIPQKTMMTKPQKKTETTVTRSQNILPSFNASVLSSSSCLPRFRAGSPFPL